MNPTEIENWLRETNPQRLETLWKKADEIRRAAVGDEVHLRGLIELSNQCRRECLYCGVNVKQKHLPRYRMSMEEVMNSVSLAVKFGYGSIVMQAGEDSALEAETFGETLRRIKAETKLAITLSLGERDHSDWELWKKAGADRYLLRFETSNQALFDAIHPPYRGNVGKTEPQSSRISMLNMLRALGYEIGSGVMVGIPGQTYQDLVNDLLLFRDIPLDMIGLGPFLPHPETVLGKIFPPHPETGLFTFEKSQRWTKEQLDFFDSHEIPTPNPENQVSTMSDLPFIMMALARILVPEANIPTTTAVATVDAKHGRIFGLQRGANVVMPNLTPMKYRSMYEIYPNKAATFFTPEQTHQQVLEHLREAGRVPGKGRGDSRGYAERRGTGEGERRSTG